MDKARGLMPVTTGILIGLAWGLLAALLEGLPLLFQGAAAPYLDSRLLALAYLLTIYGLLGAIAGGILGSVTLILGRVTRRRLSRPALAGTFSALFAAALSLLFWVQRFNPARVVSWLAVLLLAVALGLAVGWLLNGAARGGALSWKPFSGFVLGAFALAVVAVVGVACFRAFLRDRPLFNPPVTEAMATPEQPNILLITAGGLRPDHLGAYGYDIAGEPEISPNIDALAARGVRFDRALAQAPWTEPSLASLFTSLYPSELGITCRAAISCQPHLDEQRLTLTEVLKAAGYHTRAYVTDPWLVPALGFAQGFDYFETVRSGEPFDEGPMRSRTLGRLLGCRRNSAACRLFLKGHKLLFDASIPQGWGGDRVNAKVTHFLELHGEERFFLWVHYTEALPPYDLEPPFRPLPEGPLANGEPRLKSLGYWELGDPYTVREELYPLDDQGLTALYDGEVHRVDRLVGSLSGLLEGYGLTDRTVVVFASDHGQELAEHGGYTYGHSLYDEVLRVPLIVTEPGVSVPGAAIDTPVALLDLAPTLAQIAGTSLPSEAEGSSLVSSLRGEVLEGKPILSESLYRVPYELKALRQGDYKLIYNVDAGDFELYHLGLDPAEEQNIIQEESQVAKAMATVLFDWMARTARVAGDLPRAVPPAEVQDAPW
jgi:arylsulfatase A-like enzyme